MRKILIVLCLPLLISAPAFCQSDADKIEVLIVDGFSNHNWQQISMLVKTILEKSELFNVSISTSPSEPGDAGWESWNPDFKHYDVVIQNSNNIHNKEIRWPERVEKALEDYVNSGGGLFVLHSANNAFADWPEYNQMIGLGWRSPEEGIALQVAEDGQVKKIPVGEGKKTYHGPRNDEVIYILNDHPINNGFPKAWLTPDMELYKFARGPAENLTVLSYARDEETNINWPVEWTVAYGKGRVYNSSMGHLWKGETYPVTYRCIGFQTTLIRVTEWLATGNTSYDVPPDFPTEFEISLADTTDEDRMGWWRDASFGMFIHWGAYAIPGGEWNGDTCGGGAEWIMDKLDITIEDYEKEIVANFNPVKFNADAWVAMAKNAGMKYIVLTSKHHDGFCLWDSEVSDYNIMKASPFKRDIVKELSEACKKEDIVFCFYHSIVDWHHPQAQAPLYPNYNAGQKDQTVVNPEFPKYYENYLKPQVKELLTNYGDVGVVWFDGDWIADYTTEMGKEFYKFIRDIQPNTIVNNRVDKGRMGMEGMDAEGDFAGDFGTPEQEIPATGIDSDWEACMTMNGSWGYKPSDKNWKSSEILIQHLIDIVSKGGNFLLNIGPDAEGLFPPESVERLSDMGEWTKANGESIYGAKASPYDRPEWGRYTSNEGVIYAHVFDWPVDGQLALNENIKVKSATFLTEPNAKLKVEMKQTVPSIILPELAPDSIATVIKLELVLSND